MSHMEFISFGAYLIEMWPKLVLSQTQRDAWERAFKSFQYEDARAGATDAYLSGKFASPRVSEILNATRMRARSHVGELPLFRDDPELAAQIERETAEDADLVRDWPDEDMDDARREIIAHEPGMDGLIGRLGIRHPMVTFFVVERFVRNQGTILERGKEARTVTRDEYWEYWRTKWTPKTQDSSWPLT